MYGNEELNTHINIYRYKIIAFKKRDGQCCKIRTGPFDLSEVLFESVAHQGQRNGKSTLKLTSQRLGNGDSSVITGVIEKEHWY
jgi:hypothetical protein